MRICQSVTIVLRFFTSVIIIIIIYSSAEMNIISYYYQEVRIRPVCDYIFYTLFQKNEGGTWNVYFMSSPCHSFLAII